MEKLTLEHLIPYLPYQLKVLRPDNKTILEIKGINGQLIIFDRLDNVSQYGDIEQAKPILCPLSNLKNNRDLYDFPVDYIIDNDKDSELGMDEWNILFKNHYDVFGLIEKGLAIDINTLK